MPADAYGRALPTLTVNLMVRDVARSAAFCRTVFEAEVRYADPDFGALRLGAVDVMLLADHAYDGHPGHPRLAAGERRGLGLEVRLFGVDPDALAARARAGGAVVLGAPRDLPHGRREAWIEDPDGDLWAAGRAVTPR